MQPPLPLLRMGVQDTSFCLKRIRASQMAPKAMACDFVIGKEPALTHFLVQVAKAFSMKPPSEFFDLYAVKCKLVSQKRVPSFGELNQA